MLDRQHRRAGPVFGVGGPDAGAVAVGRHLDGRGVEAQLGPERCGAVLERADGAVGPDASAG